MQLSQKQKPFFRYLSAFLKCRSNFEHLQKKVDTHRFCTSEITDSKNVVREMSKKSCFRDPFNKQYGKWTQTLLKSEICTAAP